jgi:hypothetical protein
MQANNVYQSIENNTNPLNEHTMKTLINFKILAISILMIAPMMLSAQQTTREYQVQPFTEVSASSVFRVILTQSDAHSLSIEAPADLHEFIETKVSKNILHIDYTARDTRMGDEKMNIYIGAPIFLKLKASGAASFSSEEMLSSPSLELTSSGAGRFNLDVDTELLTTKLAGASKLVLSGRATKHLMEIAGASQVKAFELETEISEAEVLGASNVELTAYNVLDINASGTSRVSYKGKPETKILFTTGLAQIKGLDDGQSMDGLSENDTTLVRIGKREVVIVDGRPEKVTRKSSATRFRNNWSGLELGINGYMTPDNSIDLSAGDQYLDLEYNRSVAVNLNLWQQNLVLVRNRLALVSGIGVGWNNYRFNNNIILVKGEEELEHYTDTEHSFRKNKLTVSHLNVPLLLELQSPKGHGINSFHVSAGFNLGLRLKSHTKQVYDVDGRKNKDKDFKDFHLSPFRYEATARIGWGSVNLFATYALNNMFKENKGPELHPFAVGIRILNL